MNIIMKNIKFCLTICLLFALTGIFHGENASENTNQASSSYTFYTADKELPPLKNKNIKPLRLFASPRMIGPALVNYGMDVTIDADKRLMDSGSSSDNYGFSSKSEAGYIKHVPRIKISSKNIAIPESSLLVIEYFSNPVLSKNKSHKECVEHISLPNIAKGGIGYRGREWYRILQV